MGTYYAIKYKEKDANPYKNHIDNLLKTLNNSVSTYISTSLISQFNQAPADSLVKVDSYFSEIFEARNKLQA